LARFGSVAGFGVVGGKRRHVSKYTFDGEESGVARARVQRTRQWFIASVK
jgi:hypothetical protein